MALKRVKTRSMSKLKKDLDKYFSLYIRAKYPKRCYTCGKTNVTLQNGHFIPRQYLATRWEEMNCRPQCIGCNIFGNGQLLDFEERLTEELGEDIIIGMKQSRHKITKLTPSWYESQIEIYKEKLKTL